jgi:DNA invertase Pin-like site-specific DNA recombinase
MKKYACWRVSSTEQNEVRQLVAFRECGEGIDEILGDKMSGKNMNRPGYQRMLEKLEPGDLVIFSSLDRMSRSYQDIAEEWRKITVEKGCDILILDMKDLLDTRKGKDLVGTLISDIVVKLLSYVAETERNNIRKRQAEGIAAMPVVDGKKYSTKKGCTYGRKAISLGDDFEKFLQKQKDGLMTVNECCEALGIGRTTWYARVREYSA